MKIAAIPFLVAASLTYAQPAATEFPQESAPLTQDALKESLAGKVFSVKTASGPNWRWQLDANGNFFINVGDFKDSGKWSTKDSSICSEGRQIKASCNQVRALGSDLYLKRDNGEVVKMTPQ